MRRHMVAAARTFLAITVATGVIYPSLVTAVGQVAFRRQAEGSLITYGDRVVGSALLGQPFTGPGWFQPRPGTGTSPVSGPSNLGPSNPALAADVRRRAAALSDGAIVLPADALTDSGSGLDPDISVANARLQAPRVAGARRIPLADVLALVDGQASSRSFGFLGEPRVNVLALNLALDGLASAP